MTGKKMDVSSSDLWTAVLSRQYNLANYMIYRGANVNEPRNMENYDPVTTLLHYAVARSDVQCIRVLVILGANINARDSQDGTPLHWATPDDVHPNIIEVLINEGADVNARDHNQMTPLHYYAAKEKYCMESLQKLIAGGACVDAIGMRGSSVLHTAVILNNLEMVKVLITHKVNIDAKDIYERTPLTRCFANVRAEPKTEIIQLLLENGADVNSKSRHTLFSLLLAAAFRNPAYVHLLLKWGARVNEATDTGFTALHMACKNGLADVTALLLKFGADLNARNQKGKTPFELLPNSPSSKNAVRVIIKEAVKREALGQSLSEGYKRMVQSRKNYSKFDQKCREEVKRMQSDKIDAEDSAISFFYIFSVDKEKLAALARNEEIVTAFESSGYVISFRIYADEFITKFEVAKKRAILSAPIVRKLAAYIKYGYNRK